MSEGKLQKFKFPHLYCKNWINIWYCCCVKATENRTSVDCINESTGLNKNEIINDYNFHRSQFQPFFANVKRRQETVFNESLLIAKHVFPTLSWHAACYLKKLVAFEVYFLFEFHSWLEGNVQFFFLFHPYPGILRVQKRVQKLWAFVCFKSQNFFAYTLKI